MKISKYLYKRISTFTGRDYQGFVVNEEEYLIEVKELIKIIQDLICEIDSRDERIEVLENGDKI